MAMTTDVRCRDNTGRFGDERGSVIVLVAVSLFAVLALAALSIDLASLRSARTEAQRAADAIALAGGDAFYRYPANDASAPDSARTWALRIARQNMVRSDTLNVDTGYAVTTTTYAWGKVTVVQTKDVTLNIIPDSQKVRAWVRHPGISTFFGGMLAKPYGHVQAMATAWATNAGPTVQCLKPFLIPDMWYESDTTTQDVNKNHYMEPSGTANGNQSTGGEQWFYQPASIGGRDYYLKYDPTVADDPSHPQTGYGSAYRNGVGGSANDVGLPILFKPQTGNNQRQGNWYYTLNGPQNNLRDDITHGCIEASIGDTARIGGGQQGSSQGGMTGQATQGIQALYDLDASATWNPTTRRVENSAYSDWTQSPRVITVGLMDPIYITGSSATTGPNQNAVFNNFARLFIDSRPTGNTGNLSARFVGFAPGAGGGTTSGTLVKRLQLIQ